MAELSRTFFAEALKSQLKTHAIEDLFLKYQTSEGGAVAEWSKVR